MSGTPAPHFDLEGAREALEAAGYVVLRRKSYDHTRRELQKARQEIRYLGRDNDRTREWAEKAFAEQHRLADRLVFVYGVARAHGATHEELA